MEPKLSHLIELQIVEAKSRIVNANRDASKTSDNLNAIFIRPYESLTLTCIVEAPQETDFVYWYKNKEVARYEQLNSKSTNQHPSSSVYIQANKHEPESTELRSRGAHSESNQVKKLQSQDQLRLTKSISTSNLTIEEIQPNDTANYTCLVSLCTPLYGLSKIKGN